MHDLLAAHEAAFAHFGGRCEFLLYDRMRTVVLGTSEGRPRLNPTFASFDRANQVWAMDITYIPMARGFVYLAVVLDWFSRRVLAWRVSIDMAVDFCLEAVEEAIARHGTPDIFNTDSRGVVSALGQPVHQPGLHRPAGEQQHIDQPGRGLMATTSSSSGYGARSNTRRSTCAPTTVSARRGPRSVDIWSSTSAHHNTHPSMLLKGKGFSDRAAIPWGTWGSVAHAGRLPERR
jgi:transposase InsO family protein